MKQGRIWGGARGRSEARMDGGGCELWWEGGKEIGRETRGPGLEI
jgi:hypothetical protein